jgi:hypothetical protein
MQKINTHDPPREGADVPRPRAWNRIQLTMFGDVATRLRPALLAR